MLIQNFFVFLQIIMGRIIAIDLGEKRTGIAVKHDRLTVRS